MYPYSQFLLVLAALGFQNKNNNTVERVNCASCAPLNALPQIDALKVSGAHNPASSLRRTFHRRDKKMVLKEAEVKDTSPLAYRLGIEATSAVVSTLTICKRYLHKFSGV